MINVKCGVSTAVDDSGAPVLYEREPTPPGVEIEAESAASDAAAPTCAVPPVAPTAPPADEVLPPQAAIEKEVGAQHPVKDAEVTRPGK